MRLIIRLFSYLLLLFPLTLTAQKELKTESVSIFKDGNAFFTKQGNVKCENGTFVLKNDEIPKARFGTLWFNSATNSIESIFSHIDTTFISSGGEKLQVFATSIADLLALNQNKRVKIEIKNAEIEGIIEKVELYNDIPRLLYFKTNANKLVVFNIGEVTKVEFEEKPNNQILDRTSSVSTRSTINQKVEVKFNDIKPIQSLQMTYLQKGLKWKPFYYMELLDDKKAKITLRSEVTNNLENLENTTVNFVVGVANFKYSRDLTGLVDFRVMQEVEPVNNSYNKYPPSDYDSNELSEIVVVGSPSFNNQITGENVEDFYFYPLKNFSLPKGGRGHYQLFSEEVAYENIYVCDIVNQYDYTNSRQNGNNQGKNPNKFYHSLKISNKSKNPFTNAPVLIADKRNTQIRPLAQDLLPYTPINGSSSIKVTESPDIEIQQSETIKTKTEERTDFFGRSYYKAIVQGKIAIKNYKSKDIKLEIRQKIEGTLGKTEQEWKILFQKVQPFSPNNSNNVQWDINLKSGEEKTFTYQFDVYVDR